MYFPSTMYYGVKGSAPFDPLPLTAGRAWVSELFPGGKNVMAVSMCCS